jgi:fluoroacetyl-CoA thioesterase
MRTTEARQIEETSMKPGLKPGASHVSRLKIDRDRTIDFMGDEGRVYGTPFLVRDIEQTCRQLLLQYADPGEDSVGMEIAVKHLAPTLLEMEVEITATVTAIDGRKIAFEVTAKDELEPISTGTHARFVVDKAKTYERLKAKAAKRDARGR